MSDPFLDEGGNGAEFQLFCNGGPGVIVGGVGRLSIELNMGCILWWMLLLSNGPTVGEERLLSIKLVGVEDEAVEVVEDPPGDSGPSSMGLLSGLTARELKGDELQESE
jgi:hypothetical protein